MQSHKAPLIEHLIEFRKRLMFAMSAWIIGFAIAYLFKTQSYGFLMQPLVDAYGESGSEGRRLIYTSLPETFFTYVKLSLFTGFALAFPFIAHQFYSFVAPGLYKHEKRVVLPYLILSPLLFFAGMALAYYYVFPLAWKFFIGFEQLTSEGELPLAVVLEAKVSDYLALVMQMLIAFGLAFQLPVVLTLMARAGMVRSATLARTRKFALVGIVTVAAIFTPPDVISQVALAVPLLILYECSIISCKLIEKKQDQNDNARYSMDSREPEGF
jgi:sec-independent protein translocase protein TatC